MRACSPQWGMWRSAVSSLNFLEQCGHGTRLLLLLADEEASLDLDLGPDLSREGVAPVPVPLPGFDLLEEEEEGLARRPPAAAVEARREVGGLGLRTEEAGTLPGGRSLVLARAPFHCGLLLTDTFLQIATWRARESG